MTDDRRGRPEPRARRRLFTVAAASVVGLAVISLLVLVAVAAIGRVDGPDDTPPAYHLNPSPSTAAHP
ncbi:hypothetical protein QGN32_18090 [Mycolicibacterium sp. ND9-15]|uniref:hypothetical protein n=1 Tax=Mycolicibacterium sp. ND9-15 TaxID=3042320 RepID=UPI002DDA838F|nr:hypothetical protein [Mycolicibacterium sp. ND9-15]WSE55333.1 hypothetical protein QGN32_18090 [Mycolicibacterium sp. ND9-15]